MLLHNFKSSLMLPGLVSQKVGNTREEKILGEALQNWDNLSISTTIKPVKMEPV